MVAVASQQVAAVSRKLVQNPIKGMNVVSTKQTASPCHASWKPAKYVGVLERVISNLSHTNSPQNTDTLECKPELERYTHLSPPRAGELKFLAYIFSCMSETHEYAVSLLSKSTKYNKAQILCTLLLLHICTLQ